MQIVNKPNKHATKAALKDFMLAHCDEDIQAVFGMHSYTLEPLLCQLIRELKQSRMGEEAYGNYHAALEGTLQSLTATAGGDSLPEQSEGPAGS